MASPELSFVETRTAPLTILSPSTTRSCDNKCYVKPLLFRCSKKDESQEINLNFGLVLEQAGDVGKDG